MAIELGTGDLVQVDAANVIALARVRGIDGDRVHLAFEQGGYLPWLDEPVQMRRFGDDPAQGWDARIVHTGSSTATLEVLGRTPAPGIPEPSDTERDLDPPC